MPSTQYYVAASLDGYIAKPDGNIDWLQTYSGSTDLDSEEGPLGGPYDAFYAAVGAVAMGSATYEFIVGEGMSWPYAEVPAWVFTSRDLPAPDGADVRFARGDVEPVHAEMAAAAGDRNVWVVGGGPLASQFADKGLLDELLVTIVPVVLGEGKPLFGAGIDGELRLTGTRVFPNGMTELRYELPERLPGDNRRS